MQAGECRPETGRCMILSGHRPQCPCRDWAPDRSALQRQEGQEALRPLPEDDGQVVVLQSEPVKQRDSKIRAIPELGSPSLRSEILALAQDRPPQEPYTLAVSRVQACGAQKLDSCADQRSRNIPRRALRAPLRDHPTRSPAERDLLGPRCRGARPAPRARRASPADETPQAASEGQAVPLGGEQDAASGALGGVHRDPGHARAVAPRARSAQVDLQASACSGTSAHRLRDRGR